VYQDSKKRHMLKISETKSAKLAEETCQWIKDNKAEPRSKSDKESLERSLYNWLAYKRAIYKKRKKGSIYPSDLSVLKSFNMENLFSRSLQERKSNENTIKVCNDILSENEEILSSWLSKKREGYLKVYQSDVILASSMGFPNLFENLENEDKSNYMIHKICKWIKSHGSSPSILSSDQLEKELAAYHSNKKQAFKGQSSMKYYGSDDSIIKSYNLEHHFK